MESQNFESFKPLNEEEEKNVVGGRASHRADEFISATDDNIKKTGGITCPPGHSWNVELNVCAEHEPEHGIFTGANIK